MGVVASLVGFQGVHHRTLTVVSYNDAGRDEDVVRLMWSLC